MTYFAPPWADMAKTPKRICGAMNTLSHLNINQAVL